MNATDAFKTDSWTDPRLRVSIGRTHLGILNAAAQPASEPSGRYFIVFHGELYNNLSPLSDPEYVLSCYVKSGDASARDFEGIFHFAILDREAKTLKLFTDKFGLHPLYYTRTVNGFRFCGEVQPLLEDKEVSRELDYHCFSEFFHFGQALGRRTLLRDISLLEPATVLSYDLNRNACTTAPYWKLLDIFPKQGQSGNGRIEDVVDSFAAAVQRRSGRKEMLGISLSGGLDSRGILAALKSEARGIHSYTLGIPGCKDQWIAGELSKVAGTFHSFVPIKSQDLSDFESMASQMVGMSDGMYHPHESTEMVALNYLGRAPFRILLRGHAGELAKASLAYPVMAGPEIRNCRTPEDVIQYVLRRTNLIKKDINPNRIFSARYREVMQDGPMQSLRGSIEEAARTLAPEDVCIYYYANEHVRRQVVASLQIFRTAVEIRLPYLDSEYVSRLMTLPLSQRKTGEVQSRVVQTCMPAAMRICNSNTGAPLDAGPVRLFLTDRFSSLMKKLSMPGFRHYTEFQNWYRGHFAAGVERVLFSDRTRARGVLDVDFLQHIFRSHVDGSANYGHFLGTAAALELWQRSCIDEAADS